jgi:Mg2+ and Co2+ transporter CorA
MDSSLKPAAGPIADLGRTVLQPGLIWACHSAEGRTKMVEDGEPPADCAFRWLHLNLADQRSLNWIERAIVMPPAILQAFTTKETEQLCMTEGGFTAFVLYDFERDFDWLDTGRIGALHIVVGPRIILTGRFHPLHTADVVRRKIADGLVIDTPAAALALVLGALGDTLDERILKIANGLLVAEDELLSGGASPDTRELVTLRRLCTQIHRTLIGMRAALLRAEDDPLLAPPLLPVVTRSIQRLQTLDSEVAAAQAQLRLLRDELDLQAAQRTNRNLYFLSILTALLMPATLVTGFFGMNTGGLPFAHGAGGTALAALAAVLSSLGTYFALRLMGFVRQ